MGVLGSSDRRSLLKKLSQTARRLSEAFPESTQNVKSYSVRLLKYLNFLVSPRFSRLFRLVQSPEVWI
jgi:hypothetical protein